LAQFQAEQERKEAYGIRLKLNYPICVIGKFGMEIRSFGDSLFVMLAGAILIWFGPYLGNGLVHMIGAISVVWLKD
jgi:hypothetical protein